jgi:hypothetical protein
MADVPILNYDDLDSVAKLQKSQRFHDIMKVMFEQSFTPLDWVLGANAVYSDISSANIFAHRHLNHIVLCLDLRIYFVWNSVTKHVQLFRASKVRSVHMLRSILLFVVLFLLLFAFVRMFSFWCL